MKELINIINRLDKCRACGEQKLETFFDLGNQPLANSLLKKIDEDEKSYPLSLSWCPACNLVQLNHTVDPKELFSEYVWVTGTSSTAREYAERFCENVISHLDEGFSKGYVLEIASNDGTFLKPFIKKGYEVLGVDPAENIAKVAVAAGVPTKCCFFGRKAAEEIISDRGYPIAIFVRNVLPHVANLHDFIDGIKLCMSIDTLLAIEVHYAKVILEELHYDSIYHEHLCYFSIRSLEHLLRGHGLFSYDIDESPISGGSIILYLKDKPIKENPILKEYREKEIESNINNLSCWQLFAAKAYKHKQQLVELINKELQNNHKIIGYGASARSSTMLNFCGIRSEHVLIIADQSILKHTHYSPGTHIPIESPDVVMQQKPDTVLLLAWNFQKEISKILQEKYCFKGNIIIPFPYPPKLVNIKEMP